MVTTHTLAGVNQGDAYDHSGQVKSKFGSMFSPVIPGSLKGGDAKKPIVPKKVFSGVPISNGSPHHRLGRDAEDVVRREHDYIKKSHDSSKDKMVMKKKRFGGTGVITGGTAGQGDTQVRRKVREEKRFGGPGVLVGMKPGKVPIHPTSGEIKPGERSKRRVGSEVDDAAKGL